MNHLADSLVAGDRRSLARGITLVESTNPDHGEAAAALLDRILPRTGGAVRLGVSGTPGVGKSTFVNALGMHLVEEGHRVAVLAVDPSSARTGGSILGDKTRMGDLVASDRAFVRPSPTAGSLGGITRRTADSLLLCEAAGYDVVLVETVGVGQSETAVADVTDLFLLLLAPGGGDDLQGIKRGIMELADLIAVNKADGDLAAAADRAAADYRSAVSLVRPKWPDRPTEVMACSAISGTGIAEIWSTISGCHSALAAEGQLDTQRASQRLDALNSSLREHLITRIMGIGREESILLDAKERVAKGEVSVTSAVRSLMPTVLAPQ